MSNYRWGNSLYSTGHAAALACATDWITGGDSYKQAILNHLRDFDPEDFAAECISAWDLDKPGGSNPNPDDDATSLLHDWGMDAEGMAAAMCEALAKMLRDVADEIEAGT